MEELIARLVQNVGLDPAQASGAASTILGFVMRELPPELAAEVRQYVPGVDAFAPAEAEAAAEPAAAAGGGLFGALGGLVGGLIGGGTGDAMATLAKLNEQGLDFDQVKAVTSEIIDHARQTAGPELVEQVIAAIPALNHVLKG